MLFFSSICWAGSETGPQLPHLKPAWRASIWAEQMQLMGHQSKQSCTSFAEKEQWEVGQKASGKDYFRKGRFSLTATASCALLFAPLQGCKQDEHRAALGRLLPQPLPRHAVRPGPCTLTNSCWIQIDKLSFLPLHPANSTCLCSKLLQESQQLLQHRQSTQHLLGSKQWYPGTVPNSEEAHQVFPAASPPPGLAAALGTSGLS